MSGPAWLGPVLALVMITAALYHGVRLLTARTCAGDRDLDLVHLGMGLVMAVMLVQPIDARWIGRTVIVFAVAAGWFAYRGAGAWGSGPRAGAVRAAQQVLLCAAMIYMLIGSRALPASVAMAMGMARSAPGEPMAWALPAAALAVGMIVVSAGQAVGLHAAVAGRTSKRLAPSLATAPSGRSGPSGPALGCQLAMSATMTYMLISMV